MFASTVKMGEGVENHKPWMTNDSLSSLDVGKWRWDGSRGGGGGGGGDGGGGGVVVVVTAYWLV